jgi:hypothetical protein
MLLISMLLSVTFQKKTICELCAHDIVFVSESKCHERTPIQPIKFTSVYVAPMMPMLRF